MEYELDEQKSRENMDDRGFDFDFAARIFDGAFVEWEDKRKDYGEPRLIVLGSIDDEVFVVVYTWRGNLRRIISARRANRRERDVYRQTQGRTPS